MRRFPALLAFALFTVLIGHTRAVAEGDDDNGGRTGDDQGEHQNTSALELAGAGLGIAIVVGGAGYLMLRRRVRAAK